MTTCWGFFGRSGSHDNVVMFGLVFTSRRRRESSSLTRLRTATHRGIRAAASRRRLHNASSGVRSRRRSCCASQYTAASTASRRRTVYCSSTRHRYHSPRRPPQLNPPNHFTPLLHIIAPLHLTPRLGKHAHSKLTWRSAAHDDAFPRHHGASAAAATAVGLGFEQIQALVEVSACMPQQRLCDA